MVVGSASSCTGPMAGVDWSPLDIAQAALIALSGLIMLYAAWFAAVTRAFWFVRTDGLEELFAGLWAGANTR